MFLSLSLACAVVPVESEPAAQQDTQTEPTPYVVIDDEQDAAPLTVAEMEAGVQLAVAALLHVDPLVMHQSYETARTQTEDGYCPYYYESYLESYGQYYWYDNCNSEMGGSFAGNGRSYLKDPYVSGDYDYAYYGYFYGSARIDAPDGTVITAAGYSAAYVYTNTSNDYTYWYHDTWGEFASSDPALADTWLASGWRVDSTVSANVSPAGGKYLYLNSAISGLDGAVNAAVFEGVVIYDELRGSPCWLEPSGVISLRDSAGQWVELEFDGPPSGATTMYPPDCDGCGTAWQNGEKIGQVCPDFSAMLDWEDGPWD